MVMKYNELASNILWSTLAVVMLGIFGVLCIRLGTDIVSGLLFLISGLFTALVLGCIIWAVLYKMLGMIRGQIWPFKRENRG